MAQAGPSWQELIQRGNRTGFVGRDAERAAFLANFDLPVGDARRRFRFHVHGTAGVGKTFLVQELRQLARERGALTAYVDERAGSVPEAMAEVCHQFADQGRRLKDLERRLAVYRDRRHEAEAAALAALAAEQAQQQGHQQGQPPPQPASAGSRTAVGLGLAAVEAAVPGAGLLTSALPADLLAQGADRLRTGLSARFRNPDDIELVMSPEKVLTPVLLRELRTAASATPWIVLFLDTYERTGPFLDPWLYDLVTRHEADGGLPATVLVVTAGQRPLDTARWSGTGSVADVPLAPFTESESRGLLAGKGVVAEPVVKEVLRLTGGLPVLVSTLAETRPGDPDDVDDPSAGAVKRFLQWEPDDTRRQVARVCALPRQLDADVFRALVCHPDGGPDLPGDPDELYDWLTGLPFVGERGARVRYHDVVRAPMLRLERRRSRREWAARHRRLAETFARWRTEAEAGRETENPWTDEEWRELRLEETYHLLCARPPAALGAALRTLVEACREDAVLGRAWARMLADAGRDTDDTDLTQWGERLGEALDDDTAGIAGAMALLLARPGPDTAGRALAHTLRGRELRYGGEHRQALEEYGRALELDPRLAWAHYGRGYTHQLLDDFPAALTALDRADELAPGTGWIIAARAETYRLAGRFEEAVADFDRAVALVPADADPLTGRAVTRHALGRYDEALADFDRALGIEPDNAWALVRRARLRRTRGEPAEAFADFDRAVRVAPDAAWVASERGDAYRLAGRPEEAVAELTRALTLEPAYASALASRGAALCDLGRYEESLADFGRAVELRPDYAWALVMTARVKDELGDRPAMFAALERAVDTAPDIDWISHELAVEYREEGRYEEAVAVFGRVLDGSPDDETVSACLSGLGGTHLLMRQYEEAFRHLSRALALGPDDGWTYAMRARVCLATGRTGQALADLDRCATLEPASQAAWARRTAIELLTQCDRWAEATTRLSAADDADDLDDLRCEAHRHAGQWPQARLMAERLRARAPIPGTFELAMTVSQSEGLPAAEPLWRELASLVAADAELPAADSALGDLERTQARCFLACALSDWPAAQQGLAEFLALPPDWDDLATLTLILRDLRTSPDADARRIEPLLTETTRSRDELTPEP
ncbi:BREX system ATP-binding domain-containing protein [Streptomyces sp. NPDC017991]|uniref:BREX system ATP-binding domain-containing protein n=1 Tax=Streptomyces sp. NPDC017991 TaxID=3365026 RepID=UPI0037A5D2B9